MYVCMHKHRHFLTRGGLDDDHCDVTMTVAMAVTVAEMVIVMWHS